MSFGKMFDGYCVVHAKHATNERRVWFEKELRRVGVNYTIIEAHQTDVHDERLTHFRNTKNEYRARALISLADAMKK